MRSFAKAKCAFGTNLTLQKFIIFIDMEDQWEEAGYQCTATFS
jgi:hypothetical protein